MRGKKKAMRVKNYVYDRRKLSFHMRETIDYARQISLNYRRTL